MTSRKVLAYKRIFRSCTRVIFGDEYVSVFNERGEWKFRKEIYDYVTDRVFRKDSPWVEIKVDEYTRPEGTSA